MLFVPTLLPGAFLVEPEPHRDERGFFARTWGQREFEAFGLNPKIAECSLSVTDRRGTLRGMHYQVSPYQEAKLIRCVRGALHDVIVDLRPGSPTFRQWTSAELDAESRRMLYIPKGMAHGYMTLTDDVEAHYHVSAPYTPECAGGVAWDDPAFGIAWPFAPTVMSDRDRSWPRFNG